MEKKITFYEDLKKYQLKKQQVKYYLQIFTSKKCPHAKQKLINNYLPMALKICTKLQKNHPSIDLFDLFNQAYIIMHETIDNYDHNKKISLSTYLYNNVKWNLKVYIADVYQIVKIPKSVKKTMKKKGIPLHPISLSEIEELKISPNRDKNLVNSINETYIDYIEYETYSEEQEEE